MEGAHEGGGVLGVRGEAGLALAVGRRVVNTERCGVSVTLGARLRVAARVDDRFSVAESEPDAERAQLAVRRRR